MTVPELCPALRHDREEERVVCVLEPHVPGAWSFICRGCLEEMFERAEDRKAIAEEWDTS